VKATVVLIDRAVEGSVDMAEDAMPLSRLLRLLAALLITWKRGMCHRAFEVWSRGSLGPPPLSGLRLWLGNLVLHEEASPVVAGGMPDLWRWHHGAGCVTALLRQSLLSWGLARLKLQTYAGRVLRAAQTGGQAEREEEIEALTKRQNEMEAEYEERLKLLRDKIAAHKAKQRNGGSTPKSTRNGSTPRAVVQRPSPPPAALASPTSKKASAPTGGILGGI